MGQFFSPRNVMRIIYRRLPIILLVLIIGLPMVVYYASNRDRVYEAIAVMQIEAPQIVGTATQIATGGSAVSQLDLIQQKLTSRDSLTEMINRLGLFPEVESPNQRVGLLRGAVSIQKLIDPTQRFRPDVQPSGLIITVRMGDPEQAAMVANNFLDEILAAAEQRSDARASETLAFFTEQEARVTAEIQRVEDDLAMFKVESAGSLPSELSGQRDRLTTLREQVLLIDQQLIEIQTTADRRREEDIARQTGLLQQQRAFLQSTIAEVEAALAAAPDVERQLSSMDRQLAQLESEFEAITTSRTDAAIRAQLESQNQAQRYEILETAIVPENAVSTSRRKIAMAGGVLVGLMALGAAFLLEIAKPVIRSAAQLESQLGVQPVITVPNLRSRVQRRRQRLGFAAVAAAILSAPLWLGSGVRDVILRLFSSNAAPS